MNETVRVRFLNGLRDLGGNAQGFHKRQGTRGQASKERLPTDVLHHQEYGTGLFLYFENLTDERVIQRRRRKRFAAKALARDGIRGEMGRQDFDGYPAIQLRIVREVNLTHSAGANALDEFIAP